MKKLKALIFDVDGTLADTERDGHRVAFNHAFKHAGLSWSWDEEIYGELLAVTGGKERIRFFMERYQPPSAPKTGLDEFIKSLHQRKTRYFVELLESGAIPLRAGVDRLIKEARAANLKLGIATTTTPENVTALLKATLGEESINWFEFIAAGDVVANKKPSPDIYLYALQAMHLAADECLAFEDSNNGLMASMQAGLQTVVTVNAYTRHEDFSGAALVLDQLGEPGSSFEVLVGDAGGASHVDVRLIERIFDANKQSIDNRAS